ncbi:hypothetical protein BIW11_04594, partial [Tropilaelaps mercedesae]
LVSLRSVRSIAATCARFSPDPVSRPFRLRRSRRFRSDDDGFSATDTTESIAEFGRRAETRGASPPSTTTTTGAMCAAATPAVVSTSDGDRPRTSTETDAYTPHLKRVLKSYQAAATTSLHGPNSVRWTPEAASEKEESVSPLAPAQPPIQQPPPLLLSLPKDRCASGQRSSTLLEGESIACFNVGGEDRLCLPQILNTVLRDFSLVQINSVCDDLQIYCSRCTDDQLAQLKQASILPYRVPSCGLISKSDAERLCASLLHVPVEGGPKEANAEGLDVYHECFGGCEGLFYPDIYAGPNSACVRCLECRGMLSPRHFIAHVHRARAETRTCHWGFSSANWRQYLLATKEEDPAAKELLDQIKTKFDKRKKFLGEQLPQKLPFVPTMPTGDRIEWLHCETKHDRRTDQRGGGGDDDR